jgi:hypothetical protein
MLSLVSFYNKAEHTIVDSDIARFCNRIIEGDPKRRGRLFTLRYNKLGVFVIAEWLSPPECRGPFVDVLNLGASFGNFTRTKAGELRDRLLNPITAEETNSQTTQADSDYHHNLQDENEEETERWARVARGE